MAELSWEDGLVKIGGQELPGLLVDQTVGCRVRFDEQKVDGQSGQKKIPLGWEDTEVNLTLILITDEGGQGLDCYDKLDQINQIFKGHDDKANPKVLSVDNRHLLARGVSELIFSGLESAEDDQSDTITAMLSFVENNPPVVKTERAVAKSAQAQAAAKKAQEEAQGQVNVPDVDPGPGLTIDLE